MLTVAALLVGACVVCPPECLEDGAWSEVIESHVARYPGMQAADLYKLLHQATMGAGHAVPDVDAARRWLMGEIGSMGEGPAEPLVDTIAPRGGTVRVHLRPFVASGRDPEELLDAFVRSANEHQGATPALACALDAALGLAREGSLPWPESDLGAYFDARRAEGYPAVHHSPEFESRFRPAYRILDGSLVTGLLAGVGEPPGAHP